MFHNMLVVNKDRIYSLIYHICMSLANGLFCFIESVGSSGWCHPFKGCMSSPKAPHYVKRNFSRLC